MKLHTLGLPRIGGKRELKFALEAYWDKKITLAQFNAQIRQLKSENWQWQLDAGLDFLTIGDFPLYDQVLDTSLLFSVIPERYQDKQGLDLQFAVARGIQNNGCNHSASEMTKWFNTNYHYLVPEINTKTQFKLNSASLLAEVEAAKIYQKALKVKLIGPITYLWLAKVEEQQLNLLYPQLVDCYQTLFSQLAQANVEWIQIEEPILTTEPNSVWLAAIKQAYQTFATKNRPKLLLTTYFSDVELLQETILALPVEGIHLDCIAAQPNLDSWLAKLNPQQILSLGVIDGRNVWRTDLATKLKQVQAVHDQLSEQLWLAPSCSLQHVPVDLSLETNIPLPIKSWLAFAKQKLIELTLLKSALLDYEVDPVIAYSQPVVARLNAAESLDIALRQEIEQLKLNDCFRASEFENRIAEQQAALNLPLLPTTTIGSFPQTEAIRKLRADYKFGRINQTDYEQQIKAYVSDAIKIQAEIGLDVFVHGEPERNDMVEYFGELLQGFVISQYGWVQSYGSRCVKPPIIFGDVRRVKPLTVELSEYAQSLTNKPVKGMLTGPITILNWSFVRDDIARSSVAKQIAFALRQEVIDLEQAGISIIQVDEPALREGLPLKQSQWQYYLSWATQAFRMTTSAVKNRTQIHTHMCYSEFQDIVGAIAALDADVISIEAARSDMALLKPFGKGLYQNHIGLGVYDIHSPNVPLVNELVDKINLSLKYISLNQCWINPDCGLKTRKWDEVVPALKNMVLATNHARRCYLSEQDKLLVSS